MTRLYWLLDPCISLLAFKIGKAELYFMDEGMYINNHIMYLNFVRFWFVATAYAISGRVLYSFEGITYGSESGFISYNN